MSEERTYTQAELDALLEEERQAQARSAQRAIAAEEARAERLIEEAREAAVQSIREVKAQAQAYTASVMEKRAEGYLMGISGEAQCGAAAPSAMRDGEPVRCQREPGHQIGPYDRHKAVFGEPHEAVVWNE